MIKALKGSTPGVLVIRLVVSAIIVFATYNPTGNSIFHWIRFHETPGNAWVVLVGIIFALMHVALLVAAWKALGKIGIFIALVLVGALVYLSLQEGWVSAANLHSMQWLGLILYSVFLGVGLSGAILWRRATGQVVTDEAGDIESH